MTLEFSQLMTIGQVDYNNLADLFDQGRALSPAAEALWLDLFSRYLGLRTDSRVLDVGCGTGRFAIPIAERLQCSVVGIDPSASMLARAKESHPHGIDWILAVAEAIPLQPDAFDACLVSQVIHHFRDKSLAFAEIYRVLRPGGRLGIRLSSHAQLLTILDYKFFPSALEIDQERLPDITVVKRLLRATGFNLVGERIVHQKSFDSAEGYLKKLECKYSSALTLISEQEYLDGLEMAAAYFGGKQIKTADAYADITFLVGIK